MELITYDKFKETCDKLRNAKDLDLKTSLNCIFLLCLMAENVDPETIPSSLSKPKTRDELLKELKSSAISIIEESK